MGQIDRSWVGLITSSRSDWTKIMVKRNVKKTVAVTPETPASEPAPSKAKSVSKEKKPLQTKDYVPWPQFIQEASESELVERISKEVKAELAKTGRKHSGTCFVLLLDSDTSIGVYELDRKVNKRQ